MLLPPMVDALNEQCLFLGESEFALTAAEQAGVSRQSTRRQILKAFEGPRSAQKYSVRALIGPEEGSGNAGSSEADLRVTNSARNHRIGQPNRQYLA